VVFGRRLASGVLCFLVHAAYLPLLAVQFAITTVVLVFAGLVMGVIAVAILAIIAAETTCGKPATPMCAMSSQDRPDTTGEARQAR
jgi:hypothetical protein